ncbi:uncharacterized protein METZ01_LOCUS392845 [marine metagenome]|jgi:hypothetical protein|uniref:Uncharacterized protein n=1 Tax=marine metagenome TaxID=408172 RepID=A0A382V264_9ZZZZ
MDGGANVLIWDIDQSRLLLLPKKMTVVMGF